MTTQNIDILSLQYDELKERITGMSQPAYRAGQIFSWLHRQQVSSFDEMTNIPKSFAEELENEFYIPSFEIEKVYSSEIDGTRKFVFRLDDGNLIESVMMPYRHGNSVCVSSQVGCDMGCAFCASTIDGCVRNLRASEMLLQVYEIQKYTGQRISNVVVMGMGEPLINYNNTVAFVRLLSDENALNISQRNITISTCGIVPAILRLSEESLKITLALSLHAPDDKIRQSIMPIAGKYSISEITDACDRYFEKTGRRVTYEYCLIYKINDRPEHAKMLAGLLKGKNAHVNLIPVNPTPDNDFKGAKEADIEAFARILENAGITTTRRREMGRDIKASCGQLVRRRN